jgi:MoxR-like ATPase
MTDTETERTETVDRQTPAPEPGEIDIESVSDVVDTVIANVERVMVGHYDEIEHIMTALLGRGHILLEDVPGVGKTMLAT